MELFVPMKKQTRQKSGTAGSLIKTGAISFYDVFLCVIGGMLMSLSFPKAGVFMLAWICLIPLLFAIRDKAPAKASLLGLVFGLTAYIGILYWTVYPVSVYGGISVALAVVFMLLLVSYISLYLGLFAAFVAWTRARLGLSAFVSAPIAFVFLEYLRSFFITGFPWGLIGQSQLPWLTLMQVLDITGVFGVSFVVVAVNAALFLAIEHLARRSGRFPLVETAVSALLVAVLVIYGVFAIKREQAIMRAGTPVEVALVQPNIRQDLKWDPNFQEESMRIYEDMTLGAAPHKPSLVVWPETATPFFFQNHPIFRPRVEELPRRVGAPLLFGTPAYEDESGTIKYYNRAYLLSEDGNILGQYDKIHLVPFVEYVPMRWLFFFVDKLAKGAAGDFSKGTITDPIITDIGPVGTLICYEAIFPESARIFARNGACLLVNITNDAWFGTTSAPYQHFSMARMRSIETRLFLVRAANTGISTIVDPTGKDEIRTDIFTRTVALGEVIPKSRLTFYTRFGDVFAKLITAVFFAPFIVHAYRILGKKKRRK
jgi:apolipoprotein N-acyltransferase